MRDYRQDLEPANQVESDYVSWFRDSMPYINAHRGKLFVLMICGEAIAHNRFADIIHDIALLNTLGIKLVIVHGSRFQIERRLAAKQHVRRFHNGLPITDPIVLDSVIEAAGALRAKLESQLSMSLANSPMHMARIRVTGGNFIVAKPVGIVDGIDFQSTGEVRRIDHASICHQLEFGNIVIIGPLGYSPTGEVFNLGIEDVAIQVATSLKADKLLAFEKRTGIYDSEGALRRELTLQEARHVVEKTPQNRRLRFLMALLRASDADISHCHLVSYMEDGALLKELFTRDGCGSMISRGHGESIRPACVNDVQGIIDLIRPLELEGVLLKRSRDSLESDIKHFTVIERDGKVIACAALYSYLGENCGELACFVTNPQCRGEKCGGRLLSYIELQARKIGLGCLFLMTTCHGDWFLEQGFMAATQADLPNEKRVLYDYRRNPKIFLKRLATQELPVRLAGL